MHYASLLRTIFASLAAQMSPCTYPQATFDSEINVRFLLGLVFTSDGVVVGVAIRRVERYDLVKIKPTESEAEH